MIHLIMSPFFYAFGIFPVILEFIGIYKRKLFITFAGFMLSIPFSTFIIGAPNLTYRYIGCIVFLFHAGVMLYILFVKRSLLDEAN